MSATTKNTSVNVYRHGSVWSYSLWIDGQYDSSDTLGIDDSATEAEAMAEAREQNADAEIVRVSDV